MTLLDNIHGFLIVLEEDEGGWYIAHVPELPGCISEGESFSSAVLNITGAIDDYLEIIRQDDPDRYASLTQVTVEVSPDSFVHGSTGSDQVWVAD